MPSAKGAVQSIALIIRRLLLGFNIVTLIVLWGVAACQWVSPDTFVQAGFLCMSFPVVLLANLLFIPLWLFVYMRYVLVPLVGIALVGGSIYSYCPVMNDGRVADTAGVLRIVTYNTHGWGGGDAVEDGVNKAVQWMCDQRADIALVQEVSKGSYVSQLEQAGYTVVHTERAAASECVLTRLPVLGSGTLDLPTLGGNGGFWVRLQADNGDTLVVVNVHLESFCLDEDDKGEYRHVVRHITDNDTKRRGRVLVSKLRPVLARHAQQADSLLAFVRGEIEAGRKVIVGGDFNDVPNSYAACRMRSALSDCYRKGGNGPGFTFSEQLMYFRIDHLFCSPEINVCGAYVDKQAVWSDHYPVVATLRLEDRE